MPESEQHNPAPTPSAANATHGQDEKIVVYTGPDQPLDADACHSLLQAYRNEIAVPCVIWRSRYAPLPMQITVAPAAAEIGPPSLEAE